MPQYRIRETVVDVHRKSVLVDTNVLFAAFGREDGRMEYARYLLETDERQLLVPCVVVVEAWGLLVGRGRDKRAGLQLLGWISSPGRATLIPEYLPDVRRVEALVRRQSIDCVDAMLAELATDITRGCKLNPPLLIATFDTGDFTRMMSDREVQLGILDMQSYDEVY